MQPSRRDFLKKVQRVGAGCAGAAVVAQPASASALVSDRSFEDRSAVLVDITKCVGCRRCEYACQEAAGFDVPPLDTFEDKSVFERIRRPEPGCYTVVNRFEREAAPDGKAFAKVNCLHCNRPACVSACLVGALRKEPNGAVTYDADKCMGCRYCMVACPFQIPTYDYDNPLTPQVRKCTFCFDRITREGEAPACVKICPEECLTFGRRGELLELAHERIAAHPDSYVDHIYGEHEAGGTSWLYLSAVPFEELGFLRLGAVPPSDLTEAIQHGVFKYFMPPIALYALLGLIMWLGRRDDTPPTEPAADAPAHTDVNREATRSRRPRSTKKKELVQDASVAGQTG